MYDNVTGFGSHCSSQHVPLRTTMDVSRDRRHQEHVRQVIKTIRAVESPEKLDVTFEFVGGAQNPADHA